LGVRGIYFIVACHESGGNNREKNEK